MFDGNVRFVLLTSYSKWLCEFMDTSSTRPLDIVKPYKKRLQIYNNAIT